MKESGNLWVGGTAFVGKALVRWNLGAGERPIAGYINQDLYSGKGIDKVFDLNKKWPIKTASVDQYICFHTLEHLDDPIHFFREVERTLKVGGTIIIETPYSNSNAAMDDPTHKRPYSLGTFMTFTKWRQETPAWNPQHNPKNGFPSKFELISANFYVAKEVKRIPFWRWWAIPLSKYLLNIVTTIRVEMKRIDD